MIVLFLVVNQGCVVELRWSLRNFAEWLLLNEANNLIGWMQG